MMTVETQSEQIAGLLEKMKEADDYEQAEIALEINRLVSEEVVEEEPASTQRMVSMDELQAMIGTAVTKEVAVNALWSEKPVALSTDLVRLRIPSGWMMSELKDPVLSQDSEELLRAIAESDAAFFSSHSYCNLSKKLPIVAFPRQWLTQKILDQILKGDGKEEAAKPARVVVVPEHR